MFSGLGSIDGIEKAKEAKEDWKMVSEKLKRLKMEDAGWKHVGYPIVVVLYFTTLGVSTASMMQLLAHLRQ